MRYKCTRDMNTTKPPCTLFSLLQNSLFCNVLFYTFFFYICLFFPCDKNK